MKTHDHLRFLECVIMYSLGQSGKGDGYMKLPVWVPFKGVLGTWDMTFVFQVRRVEHETYTPAHNEGTI